MAGILTDAGAEVILKRYFKGTSPVGGTNLTVKLFTNDITPTEASVAGDFTEAVGGGYTANAITEASAAVSVVTGVAQTVFTDLSFVFTGPLTTNPSVYGYFVVDADGVLIWADRATGPYTPASDGDLFVVRPTFKLNTGTIA